MFGTTKKCAFIGLAIVCVALVSGTARADGILIDGQLADWGVTPFSDWVPSPGTAYVEENHPNGSYPYGGERFDAEALYVNPQPTQLRLAIITSFPEAGLANPNNSSVWISAGDLLLDLDQTDGRAWEWAITLNGPNKGAIYFQPTLILPQGSSGLPANGPSNVDVAHSGSPVGQAQVAWHNYGDLEGFGSPTYGIEIVADWSDLGGPTGLTSILAHHTMGCGNDALDIATVGSPVPEPATIGLLLIGGLSLAAKRYRRQRNA